MGGSCSCLSQEQREGTSGGLPPSQRNSMISGNGRSLESQMKSMPLLDNQKKSTSKKQGNSKNGAQKHTMNSTIIEESSVYSSMISNSQDGGMQTNQSNINGSINLKDSMASSTMNTYQNQQSSNYYPINSDVNSYQNKEIKNQVTQNHRQSGVGSLSVQNQHKMSIKKDLEIQIPQDEYVPPQGDYQSSNNSQINSKGQEEDRQSIVEEEPAQDHAQFDNYDDNQSEVQRVLSPSVYSQSTEFNRVGGGDTESQSVYSQDTSIRRMDIDSQSDFSKSGAGTVIQRMGRGSIKSQYTDTSMVRVVEDDMEDEENYLKSLDNEQNAQRLHTQSINQKLFPLTSKMNQQQFQNNLNNNSNNANSKRQRKLTDERDEEIQNKLSIGNVNNNAQQMDFGDENQSDVQQLRDASGSMQSFDRGSSNYQKGNYFVNNLINNGAFGGSLESDGSMMLRNQLDNFDLDSQFDSNRNTLVKNDRNENIGNYVNNLAFDDEDEIGQRNDQSVYNKFGAAGGFDDDSQSQVSYQQNKANVNN
eukprot:403367286